MTWFLGLDRPAERGENLRTWEPECNQAVHSRLVCYDGVSVLGLEHRGDNLGKAVQWPTSGAMVREDGRQSANLPDDLPVHLASCLARGGQRIQMGDRHGSRSVTEREKPSLTHAPLPSRHWHGFVIRGAMRESG